MLIASITLSARCAVDGGVDYENAPGQHCQNVYPHGLGKKHNDSEGNISSQAHRYIDEHVGEHLSGQVVADALGISRSYLSLQFKKETRIGLNEFINQVKVNEAKRLLLTTDMTAAGIAFQLSFSSPAYFSTIFKRIAGKAPNKFRQNRSAVL